MDFADWDRAGCKNPSAASQEIAVTEEQAVAIRPDLTEGVAETDFVGGKLLGHVGDQDILLVQSGGQIFAIDAHCTHYHGPLADGLVVGNTIRCPWHHACFDLRSGEAMHAPAIAPLTSWRVEQREGRIFVSEQAIASKPTRKAPATAPEQIVIVGGGAAGYAAAEMLRRLDYAGRVVMLSKDGDAPVDRPNLSKDYLAGTAPAEWVPLQPDEFYKNAKIDLRLNTEVASIGTAARRVVAADGASFPYDRLLLATGAEPVRLTIPGAQQANVFALRSFADCRAIIQAASGARRAVIIGASFIGLEVAAALRTREIEVHVVAPEKRPMERILGPGMGDFIHALHVEHGVVFHLEDSVTAIAGNHVTLGSGNTLEADFVVAGIGVRPRLSLAEQAGLAMDRGVTVDACLETSVPGIYAAGDIARWPDAHSGQNIRVEHWVVAERQGQTAARNMLGDRSQFDAVPFFWSQHYDVPINYLGHAERWDEIVVEGDIAARDCLLKYRQGGRTLAVASIFRDLESLEIEAGMEADS
jgi:NADPH-dependent 2,4-dienoyl-CoA reductase/sulfur reductase-like enzyme/nitrite reductase/ring-hydroxylating ferredoxin subunit